ncbi:helix-turn-helix domain-containing protein [Promicromonospora sp. Populi]|uniref:helix-turn-helix domain-containing protein n=1 Tax=Promicromonospora sp. Populi TaxID=3239420 RepID=UPI0034E1DBED
MPDDDSIGLRIAQQRKARGITQIALAHDAGVSVSLLRKMEQGSRIASQPVVAALARALHVDVATLTGQPYDRDGPHPDRIHTAVPDLRRALAYWNLSTELETAPRSPVQLAAGAAEIATLYQLDRNFEVAQRLPALLMEAFATVHDTDGDEREVLFDALMGMFYAAHAVTYQSGYEDLSTIVEDRIMWVAAESGDPMMKAFASWVRTTSLMRLGAYDAGLGVLDQSLDEIDPGSREDRAALRMTGSLHLRSAILAARANRADDAAAHIAEARQAAAHTGADTDNDWRNLAFGQTNVDIHAVATAVESGDGPRALTLADEMRFSGDVTRRLPIRIGHHHMDVARAQLWQGRTDSALVSLEKAKKFAPQQTRRHPTTREVTRMLVRAGRRANDPLARFATWLGTDADW